MSGLTSEPVKAAITVVVEGRTSQAVLLAPSDGATRGVIQIARPSGSVSRNFDPVITSFGTAVATGKDKGGNQSEGKGNSAHGAYLYAARPGREAG